MNSVQLLGNLARDPDVRSTKTGENGYAVYRGLLAVLYSVGYRGTERND